MFYACAIRFDVTENLKKKIGFQGELNEALIPFFRNHMKMQMQVQAPHR